MSAQPHQRLTADEFVAWAEAHPDGKRYELFEGELVAMSPEKVGHTRTKFAATKALEAAINAAGHECEALIDGMAVRIDDLTVYEPDALVRCGPPLPDDEILVTDAVIVVEVVSPSSRTRDTSIKLEKYFRVPTIHHYLILWADARKVIHHERGGGGRIQTTILAAGTLDLSPPGITVELADLFP